MSTSRFPARRTAVVAVAALMLIMAACGSDNVVKDGALAKDKGVPTVALPTSSTTPTTAAPLPGAAGKPCKPATDIKPEKGQPTSVLMPSGVPPKTLGKSDLKVGTGATAAAGDTITANYLGIVCSTGKEFQSSWGSTPFTSALNSGPTGVIPGWAQGIPGMKVGGERELVIPPALGYADSPPAGSGIAPGETLVFVIQLLKVAPPGAATTTTSSTLPVAIVTTTTAPATTTTSGAAKSTTVPQSTTTG